MIDPHLWMHQLKRIAGRGVDMKLLPLFNMELLVICYLLLCQKPVQLGPIDSTNEEFNICLSYPRTLIGA